MSRRPLPEKTALHLAFAGDGGQVNGIALDAFYGNLCCAGQAGIRPAKRSLTDIFKPSAGIPGYRVTLEDLDEIRDPYDCDMFSFPKSIPWKYRATVTGNPEEVEDICRKICGLLGIACCIVTEYGRDLSVMKVLQPAPRSTVIPYEDVLQDMPGTG